MVVLCQYGDGEFVVNGELEYGTPMVQLPVAGDIQIGQTLVRDGAGSNILQAVHSTTVSIRADHCHRCDCVQIIRGQRTKAGTSAKIEQRIQK